MSTHEFVSFYLPLLSGCSMNAHSYFRLPALPMSYCKTLASHSRQLTSAYTGAHAQAF